VYLVISLSKKKPYPTLLQFC